MDQQEVVLKWESPDDPKAVVAGLGSLGFTASEGGESPEVFLLDVRAFHDVKTAMAKYQESNIPTLVVVESVVQETAILQQLRAGDDICLAELVDSQAPIRLARIIAMRRSSDVAWPGTRGAIDSLTGLQNRAAFFLHLFDDIREIDPGSPLSAIMVDLDHLKSVNDRHGHSVGDEILASVGEILRRVCLGARAIARIGGDEFIVTLRSDQDQADRMAKFLCQEIADHEFAGAPEPIRITASIGVATTHEIVSGEELIREADMCLYAAKGGGRNKVVSSTRFASESEERGEDPAIADFENRVRVLTERLVQGVAARGKKMAQQFREEADNDGLTGLYTRRYFDHRLQRDFERARSTGAPLSILFLDIDHFGKVNKTRGFPTGDRALRYVAGVLRDSVRVIDWVARYGGEEFCVVLPDAQLEEAVNVAQRIRKRIEAGTITAYDGERFSLTASLGAGLLSDSDQSIEDFVQRASDRTREAKLAGRNSVKQ